MNEVSLWISVFERPKFHLFFFLFKSNANNCPMWNNKVLEKKQECTELKKLELHYLFQCLCEAHTFLALDILHIMYAI